MNDDRTKKIGYHQYKGIDVWYEDFNEHWVCELERSHQKHISLEKLADVRKRIDSFVKKERKFVRYEAIHLTGPGWRGEGAGEIVTVTSLCEEPDKGYCWAVNKGGTRSKENLKNIALKTDANRMAFDGFMEVRAESEKLEKQANRGIRELGIGYEEADEDDDA